VWYKGIPRQEFPVQRSRIRLLVAAVLLSMVPVVVFTAPAPALAQAAPNPAALGPFAVGHESFTVTDPMRQEVFAGVLGPRTLAVDVWYPVTPGQDSGALAFYSFQVLGLGFRSAVAHEGPPAVPNLARPLVVFSHGSGGISVQSTSLCETLASHGFVVAAPNHTGNTAGDAFFTRSYPSAVILKDRPLDISVLIDRMIARNQDPSDRFYHGINPFQIGVAGHSLGGFTALASAIQDPRVRAIMPIAPAARILTDAQLASIRVPAFVLGGTIDSTTPLEPNSRIVFELPVSRRVYRADIRGAGHSDFASVCKLADVLFSFNAPLSFVTSVVPGYLETCGPGAFPIAEVERIQNLYAVSFFRRHLMQDTRYEAALTTSYAQIMEPNVRYLRRDTTYPLFWQAFLAALERPAGAVAVATP